MLLHFHNTDCFLISGYFVLQAPSQCFMAAANITGFLCLSSCGYVSGVTNISLWLREVYANWRDWGKRIKQPLKLYHSAFSWKVMMYDLFSEIFLFVFADFFPSSFNVLFGRFRWKRVCNLDWVEFKYQLCNQV